MAPILKDGDDVSVIPKSAQELRPGDIVLFGGSTLHRYLYRAANGLVARGDAASSTDPIWPEQKVYGIVVSRRRNSRSTPLRTPWRLLRGKLTALYWWSRHCAACGRNFIRRQTTSGP